MPSPPSPLSQAHDGYMLGKSVGERGSDGVEVRDRIRIFAPVLPLSPAYLPEFSTPFAWERGLGGEGLHSGRRICLLTVITYQLFSST